MSHTTWILGVDTFESIAILTPSFLIALGFSILCGLMLGWERERKEKPAGLRTITLIIMGSTVFVFASRWLGGELYDPARVAAQVVTGVGFIGGGAIYRSEGWVQGITTAATIWIAAAIGLLIGMEHHFLGLLTTTLALAVLIIIPHLETILGTQCVYESTKIYLTNEGKRKGWIYLKEIFEKHESIVEFGPDKEYMNVKICTKHSGHRHPFMECSQSYFVERIEHI
jgi:putative Mg2+ transporter-C (MgtC) family protein